MVFPVHDNLLEHVDTQLVQRLQSPVRPRSSVRCGGKAAPLANPMRTCEAQVLRETESAIWPPRAEGCVDG